ncbi:MAG: TetR/AcrR family transcriptional regulator [Actinomycetota bacterium]|nr:TetR/AcrR family transcriptional regulator [Actinomycetota bacterium]
MAPERPYHHGDLRRALIESALAVLAEDGPAAISLRDLARRAGVSHAAPTHHFGDKRGLFTAIAVEGYDLLAAALVDEWDRSHDFAALGVTYVVFAVEHRGHFGVMFRPDLVDGDDPELVRAGNRARDQLYGPIGGSEGPGAADAAIAAWALVHGLAQLWVNGAIDTTAAGADVAALARRVTRHLDLGTARDQD